MPVVIHFVGLYRRSLWLCNSLQCVQLRASVEWCDSAEEEEEDRKRTVMITRSSKLFCVRVYSTNVLELIEVIELSDTIGYSRRWGLRIPAFDTRLVNETGNLQPNSLSECMWYSATVYIAVSTSFGDRSIWYATKVAIQVALRYGWLQCTAPKAYYT